jgi:O-antigen/teichoic acid export membrane protein
MILISLPLAIFIAFNSYEVNFLLYGKSYEAGGTGLSFIVWTIIPLGFNYVLGYMLISLKKQNYCALGVGLGAFFNIFSNLILIPKFGIVGACVSAFVTETIIFLVYGYFTLKYFQDIGLISMSLKVFFISISDLLLFFIYNTYFGYNFYAVSLIFTCTTLFFIFLTKILKIEDIRKIIRLAF